MPPKCWETIEFLSGSIHRYHVLKALREHPMEIRDLRDQLDVPRTTIQRNVSELEEKGWVRRTDAGYETTLVGGLILDKFAAAVDSVRQVQSVAPFFEWTGELPGITAETLEGAVVTTPEPHQPHNPLNALVDSLHDATRVRAILPTISTVFLGQYFDTPKAEKAVDELILSKEICESCHYIDSDHNLLWRQNGINCYAYESDIPVGIFLFDNQVSLTAYDDEGRIRALLESEATSTREWAEELYGEYRSVANELSEIEP
ncbi:helix-turn-helix transcriptional regulator [Halopiger thermotolerans]